MGKYVKGEEIKRICGTVITASTVDQASTSQNINFYWSTMPISNTISYIAAPEFSKIIINGQISEPIVGTQNGEITFDPTSCCIKFIINS